MERHRPYFGLNVIWNVAKGEVGLLCVRWFVVVILVVVIYRENK